jgi:hypothetical protein
MGRNGVCFWRDARHTIFDDMWYTSGGPLGFIFSGSGGASTLSTAVSNYPGITRLNCGNVNTTGTWTAATPLKLTNTQTVEIVFRPWPSGTSSTNSICIAGMLSSRTDTLTAFAALYYDTAYPAQGWNIVSMNNGTQTQTSFPGGSFNSQLADTWLKISFNNNWDNTLTCTIKNLATLDTDSVTVTVVSTNDCYLGVGVKCRSGTTAKYVDIDSCKLDITYS